LALLEQDVVFTAREDQARAGVHGIDLDCEPEGIDVQLGLTRLGIGDEQALLAFDGVGEVDVRY